MKKKLKIALLIIFIGIVSLIGYGIYSNLYIRHLYEKQIQQLPDFSLHTTEGKTFSKENLSKNRPIIFVFFNTECEFCQQEITNIQKYWDKFPPTQWVFVSMETPEQIRAFAKETNLFQKKNVVFLTDQYLKLSEKFKLKSFPTIVLYNQAHQFIKKYRGEVTMRTLWNELKTK